MSDDMGWYADIDEDQPTTGPRPCPWRPYLNTNQGWIPGLSAWFHTKKECEEFIRDFIIGTGWDEDAPETIEGS